MNFKRLSVVGLAFSLFSLFVFASVYAESKAVVPLQITFESSSNDMIEGKITGTYTKKDIEKIMFTLAGDFDGDGDREKHEFHFDWEERYRENGDVFFTFKFNLAHVGVATNFLFMGEFLNAEAKRVAGGTMFRFFRTAEILE